MSEIERTRENGLNVVSLFSGAGGSCLGFRMSGFRIVYANEFVPLARATYHANNSATPVDASDVRDVTAARIRELAQTEDIDVLEGSPPCAAFSTSGTRSKGWNQVREYSGKHQRVDDLFFEYTRILRELRPRVFVAENVRGFVEGPAKGVFLQVLRAMQEADYLVRVEKLDGQWLGIPQSRERLIFVGVRRDLAREPVFPKPYPFRYTITDALPYVRRVKLTGRLDNWQDASTRAFPTLTTRSAATNMNAYFSAAFVETTTGERRRLNIEEVKRLSSFPDDFVLIGNFEQQWERITRAVPPLMMRAVADSIRDRILTNEGDTRSWLGNAS